MSITLDKYCHAETGGSAAVETAASPGAHRAQIGKLRININSLPLARGLIQIPNVS